MIPDVEDVLNEEAFFGDSFDAPIDGIKQHRKLKCLKGTISKGKTYLLEANKNWHRKR